MPIVCCAVAIAAAVASGACGAGKGASPDASAGSGGDAAGSRGDGAADAASSGGNAQCNQLVDDAPLNTYQFSSASPPSPMGGTIASGIYDSTLVTYYGAPGSCVDAGAPPGAALKYVITALSPTTGTIESVARASSGAALRGSFSYTTNASNLELVSHCAFFPTDDAADTSESTKTVGYTASATELLFISPSPGCGTAVGMLTKR
jgi:hypothetical protein